MPYAVVDIETTGSYANGNGITEIAIILFDGEKEEGRYHTLLNPGMPVPRFITTLTGITNEMLYGQPRFGEVAANIYNLLKDRVFVAHNVNFDYSFIRQALAEHGFELNCRKLCTVRLSRKVFPGYTRYNLGALCRELGIPLLNAHRATGDAEATVLLLAKLIAEDRKGHLLQMLKGKNKEQYLPMHLPSEDLDQLPELPGVYYFYNSQGKVVYVGKAANLHKRVTSHFSNNDGSRRKQDLIKNVHKISHKVCGSELMALILENVEIRRLWPEYNRSQKRFTYTYGLYAYTGQNGYTRLAIEKKKSRLQPLHTFSSLSEGYALLNKLVKDFSLNAGLCFIASDGEAVDEDCASYNLKVQQAINNLKQEQPTFALVEQPVMEGFVQYTTENLNGLEAMYTAENLTGLQDMYDSGFPGSPKTSAEKATTATAGNSGWKLPCLLIEQGRFYGMGYLPGEQELTDLSRLKKYLTPYSDSDYIRSLVFKHIQEHPDKKIAFMTSAEELVAS